MFRPRISVPLGTIALEQALLLGSTKSIPTPASYAFASTHGFAALASTIGGKEYVSRRSDGPTSFAFSTTIGGT